MAYYDDIPWPTDGVLMVVPFDPALHEPGSQGRLGRCHWSGCASEAHWSAVWEGDRWAVCDEDLVLLARSELSQPSRPTTPAGPRTGGRTHN